MRDGSQSRSGAVLCLFLTCTEDLPCSLARGSVCLFYSARAPKLVAVFRFPPCAADWSFGPCVFIRFAADDWFLCGFLVLQGSSVALKLSAGFSTALPLFHWFTLRPFAAVDDQRA